LQKRRAFLGQHIIGILVLLDDPRFLQFHEPLAQDTGRHRITAVLKHSEAQTFFP
jgi:hypothetical protein